MDFFIIISINPKQSEDIGKELRLHKSIGSLSYLIAAKVLRPGSELTGKTLNMKSITYSKTLNILTLLFTC